MLTNLDNYNDDLVIRLEKDILKIKSLVDNFKLDKVPPTKVKTEVNSCFN